jgi:hypothetical protein
LGGGELRQLGHVHAGKRLAPLYLQPHGGHVRLLPSLTIQSSARTLSHLLYSVQNLLRCHDRDGAVDATNTRWNSLIPSAEHPDHEIDRSQLDSCGRGYDPGDHSDVGAQLGDAVLPAQCHALRIGSHGVAFAFCHETAQTVSRQSLKPLVQILLGRLLQLEGSPLNGARGKLHQRHPPAQMHLSFGVSDHHHIDQLV